MTEVRIFKNNGEEIKPVEMEKIGEGEDKLQNILEQTPELAEEGLKIIGKEINGIDLLALDSNGYPVVIECKQIIASNNDARKVIGQALDYASTLMDTDLKSLPVYKEFKEKISNLSEEDKKRWENPRIIIVAYEYNNECLERLENIARYLSGFDIGINIISIQSIPESKFLVTQQLLSDEEIRMQQEKIQSTKMNYEEHMKRLQANGFESVGKSLDEYFIRNGCKREASNNQSFRYKYSDKVIFTVKTDNFVNDKLGCYFPIYDREINICVVWGIDKTAFQKLCDEKKEPFTYQDGWGLNVGLDKEGEEVKKLYKILDDMKQIGKQSPPYKEK